MDITSRGVYPASALSNFAPHRFVFEGIICNSMEGLLQSFKFEDRRMQTRICKLTGKKAKIRGRTRTEDWSRVQKLWWNNRTYDRGADEYQDLLDRAFAALAKNRSFRRALRATGSEKLTHSIGCPDPKVTILTEREFCDRLTRIRKSLSRA